MADTVKAAVLHAPKDLRIESRSTSQPEAQELQIAIKRTGLCGSDLHYYNHFANGDIKVREPLILGHESAGTVVSVGSDVASSAFQVGDKVALEVGIPCEACTLCQQGRYNLCEQLRFRSSAKSFPHFQGTLQERLNHPARWCHKLPDTLTEEQGALLEPLAVALHAIKRAKLNQKRENTLVLGSGAVGLLTAQCLRSRGHSVVIADISASRVEFAVQNGFADHGVTLPLRRGASVEEMLEIANANKTLLCKTPNQTNGSECDKASAMFDATFECTGVESCVQSGIYATKTGGKLVLIGMGQPIQTLPLAAAALREVDIIGVFRYADMYGEGIRMFQSGELAGLGKLITHRFEGLGQVDKACQMAARAEDDNGQVVLKVMMQQ